MQDALRPWKCRNCGRANQTVVALDGTVNCEFCKYQMSIQPSRIKNGILLPAVYPVRRAKTT